MKPLKANDNKAKLNMTTVTKSRPDYRDDLDAAIGGEGAVYGQDTDEA